MPQSFKIMESPDPYHLAQIRLKSKDKADTFSQNKQFKNERRLTK